MLTRLLSLRRVAVSDPTEQDTNRARPAVSNDTLESSVMADGVRILSASGRNDPVDRTRCGDPTPSVGAQPENGRRGVGGPARPAEGPPARHPPDPPVGRGRGAGRRLAQRPAPARPPA